LLGTVIIHYELPLIYAGNLIVQLGKYEPLSGEFNCPIRCSACGFRMTSTTYTLELYRRDPQGEVSYNGVRYTCIHQSEICPACMHGERARIYDNTGKTYSHEELQLIREADASSVGGGCDEQ
jgi:hypothetical protein